MSYAVFDYLAWIGVVYHVVVHRGVGTWDEGLRSDLQAAIGHVQKLVVDEE